METYPAIYDISLEAFPRLEGENDDAPRIQRGIDSCPPGGVLLIPRGRYSIASPLLISNFCSLSMHKSAVLQAVRPMDFILTYNGGDQYTNLEVFDPDGRLFDDLNLFIIGGELDGNGLASCLSVSNYHHFTLKDSTLRNGKQYGLKVGSFGHGYELIASNLYCKCNLPGLKGNVGISSNEGDSHYTDCIVVDYTVGMEMLGGGSNRLTRCHVWGGIVPPAHSGRVPAMLEDSINFKICSGDTLLRDCYADTGATGFYIAADARLCGCTYYNNFRFGLDNVVIFRHLKGSLLISEGRFTQTSPHASLYQQEGNAQNLSVVWSNNQLCGKDLSLPDPQ